MFFRLCPFFGTLPPHLFSAQFEYKGSKSTVLAIAGKNAKSAVNEIDANNILILFIYHINWLGIFFPFIHKSTSNTPHVS